MEIGIDIGSISVSAIFLEQEKIVEKFYLPHKGDIAGTVQKILSNVESEKVKICVTGKETFNHPDILHLDPIVAVTDGACHVHPDLAHILYIGGESYSLIHVRYRRLQNYMTNSSCASGTGAFLEQQASRLGMDVACFADRAARFEGTPPRVATRCAVFAKSDIIHLQQDGVSVEAIAAGLCDSLVDGLVESLFKGNPLKETTLVAGGVALNARVTRTLSRHLENMVVDELSPVLGAYGAAIYAKKMNPISPKTVLELTAAKEESTRSPLTMVSTDYPDFSAFVTQKRHETEITTYSRVATPEVYLGFDIGSTSTKAVLTDGNNEVLVGFYTRTAGKPVDAVKTILKCIREYEEENQILFHFLGVGTTGSGRKLLKNVLSADLEVNEITAHAQAAMFLYPQVDTIVEIGGQDAKFTRIANGSVTNAVMNYVCAAGTGSFIEEQAKRLDIPLENFAEEALKGKAPITSERCTVYMERDINRLIRQGWESSDIAAAVIYSVRDNYLNKVVAGAQIGEYPIFQGATARNKALVAAFEQYLNKPIKVFPYAHLTGAIGVCLLLKEKGMQKSGFKGLDFANVPVILSTEFCTLCQNNCRLTLVETVDGKEAYGMMCGRDYGDRRFVPIQEKEFNFLKYYGRNNRGTVLIPCALVMYEYLPLWRSFFQRLGFEVRVVKTNAKSFEKGKQIACAEFCAPLLTAQGLVYEAALSNAGMIFFPIFYKEANQNYGDPVSAEGTPCYFCYYTNHLPAIINARLPEQYKEKLVSPILRMDTSRDEMVSELLKHLKKYEIEREEIAWAYEKSLQDYEAWQQENVKQGQEVLAQVGKDRIGLVILGRPYNTFDTTMNASLVEKIIHLGHPTIFYDMLDLPSEGPKDSILSRIHWNYGQKIYKAARYIAESDHLFPIYLTSFRCSPDAFIMTYFKYLMEHFKKPYLIVQLDEHCSDVGYLTRVEAAIDSFKSWKKSPIVVPSLELEATGEMSLDKTILIPHVDEIAATLVAAAFKSYGYKAIVLEESSATVIKGFRYTLGGECMAIPAILGGILSVVEKEKLDPKQTVVFLPTSYVSCNFPQFPVKIAMALEREGLPIKVINTGSFNLIQRLILKMDMMLWDTIIISYALRQLGHSLRPYEVNPGETDQKIGETIAIMEEAIYQRKNKGTAWEKAVLGFQSIKIQRTRRPRVLVTGDLYVKNNDAFNQNITKKIEELGGEVISTSVTEYFHYGIELDRYEGEQKFTQVAMYYVLKKVIDSWEQYYLKPIQPCLSELKEPSWDEMFAALAEMGIDAGVHGETALTLSRAMCLARAGQIQAIVHVNPAFCCAGNVSISLLESVREKLNVPVLNIFYDGTDQPNSSLVPFMYYLRQQYPQSSTV